jgi:hypothetical protein
MTELLLAAKAMRAAQRAYMADRGNETLGKAVADAAADLDAAIEQAERQLLEGISWGYQ